MEPEGRRFIFYDIMSYNWLKLMMGSKSHRLLYSKYNKFPPPPHFSLVLSYYINHNSYISTQCSSWKGMEVVQGFEQFWDRGKEQLLNGLADNQWLLDGPAVGCPKDHVMQIAKIKWLKFTISSMWIIALIWWWECNFWISGSGDIGQTSFAMVVKLVL